MDDHRQLSEAGAGPSGPARAGNPAGATARAVGGWLRERLARVPMGGAMFVPAAFSAFWVVVILAYGFGYLASSDARPVTVVEVVFFVALLSGPVSMMWIGAWLLARSERLAQASAEQAAAASELATAVAGMREVYDGAAAEIGGRLGDHLIGLERRIDDAAGALAAMVEAVTDETREVLNARSAEMCRAVERGSATVAGTLEDHSHAIAAALEETTGAIRTTLNGRAEEMRAILGTRTRDIDRALATGSERLERKLSETATRVERGLDAVADRAEATLGARSDAIAASFGETEAGIRTALESRVTELDAVLAGAVELLGEALDGRAERVDEVLTRVETSIGAALAGRSKAMTRDLDALAEAVAQLVVSRGEAVEATMAAQSDAVTAAVGEFTHKLEAASGGLDAALKGAGERVTEALEARVAAVDAALSRAKEHLDSGVGGEVERLAAELKRLQGALAANPPATPAELANLLGETAEAMVAPERAAVSDALDRLERIEGQVRRLIYAAERAARLAPLTAVAGDGDDGDGDMAAVAAPPPVAAGDGVVLPFAEDFSGEDAPPPGWEVVLRALNFPDDAADREGNRALARARQDPQLGRLIGLAEGLLAELAGEGVYMDDLEPRHAGAADWAGFGADPAAHGVPALGGIADEVALAVARGRLTGDAGLRETAMRLVQEWHRLIGRAVASVGEDGLLVELADTRTGRAAMLMGRVTGAFPAPRAAAE